MPVTEVTVTEVARDLVFYRCHDETLSNRYVDRFRYGFAWVSDPAPKAEPSADSEDMALAKSWRKTELELRPIHGEHDARSITERLDSASKLTVIQKLIDVVRQRDAALSRVNALEYENRRLSDLASERREQASKQLALRVEAEQRAGRKNVSKLEARVKELEGKLAALEAIPVEVIKERDKLFAEIYGQSVEETVKQRDEARAHIAELERERDELLALGSSAQRMRQERGAADDRARELEAELADQRAKLAAAEERQLNTDAGMNTLRKQHEELEAENARLTTQLDGEKHHREILASDLNALIDGKPVTTHLASVVRRKHAEELKAAKLAPDAPPSPVDGRS